MADASEQTANRVKWARYVVSSYATHGVKIVEELKKLYEEYEDGDEDAVAKVEAIEGTLVLLIRRLTGVTDRMEGAELAVAAEASDDDKVRDRRDELRTLGREQFFEGRDVIERALGPKSVREYAMDKTPPRTPDRMLATLKNTVNLLEKNPQTGTDSFGNTYRTADIVATLTPTVAELSQALEDVDTEKRELTDVRANRNRLVDEWETVFRGTANALSGLYSLAGRHDLAERVRPTIARTDGRTEPPEEPAEPVTDEDVVEDPA